MKKIETYKGDPFDVLTYLQLHSGIDVIKVEIHVLSEVKENEWLICFEYEDTQGMEEI